MLKMKVKKDRIHQYLLPAFDLFLYSIISLLILIIHPSFDSFLGTRIILLQFILCLAVIAIIRILNNVYTRQDIESTIHTYGRLLIADIISFAIILVAQNLLAASDRLEVVTLFLIVVITLIASIALRMGEYELSKRSIEVTDIIPFSPPDISELEVREVEKALRSGWITTGPRTKKLENMLAEYIGVPKCVCLNSNTACGEMALRLLGVGPGDEVITSAYTYTASASVVCHVGATLKMVDCLNKAGSLEIDYDALENAITTKTKAIIPVDLAGIPCDYDRLFEIVDRKKNLFTPNNDIQKAIGRVAIIADAAHALGATYKGKKVGAIADFTNFSFHAVKNFTTGEGGAITWRHIEGIDDNALYHQAQLYSLHGQSKDALAKTQKGGWEYDIVGTWYKCNMTDVAAAIGLAQLERYPHLLAKRRRIIEKYDDAFKKLGVEVLDHYNDEHTASGHLYITRIPGITPEQRNEIIVKMTDRNVSCNVHYKPLPMMTAYKELGFDIEDYPNAYGKFANEVTLPLYSTLSDSEVEHIIKQFTEVVSEYIA